MKALERIGWVAVLGAVLVGGTCCVQAETAAAFAKRAYPECAVKVLGHQVNDGNALTEIELACSETTRSITVKCSFGIVYDTVCHENQ